MLKYSVQFLVILCCVLNDIQAQTVEIKSLLKSLNIEEDCCRKSLIKEKKLPNQPDTSIVIIPIEKPDMEVQVMYLDAYLLLVNNQTNRIIRKQYLEQAWISDAVRLIDLEIDTAPYWISDKNRAFGIKAIYSGSSSVNPFSSAEISLFIPTADGFKQVLKDYTVSRTYGENNAHTGGVWNAEMLKRTTLLIMTKKASKGYYDIRTRAKFNKTVIKNDVQVLDSTYLKSGLLRFDGHSYSPIKQDEEE